MIDTFFNALRNVVITTIFVMFAAAMVYVPQPQAGGGYQNVETVHAGGVTFDPINLVQNTLTAVQTAISVVADQWILLKEQFLDNIAWVFAKNIIADMTESTVDWVRSGFNGSPRFVQNLDQYLERISDGVVEGFLNEILDGNSFLCSPFEFDVALTVAISTDFERERTQVECSIDEVFANVEDFEDFLEGDFFSGGWDGWFNMVGNPNNTLYGSRLSAQSQARQIQAEREEERRTQLSWADGYLALEECSTVDTADGPVESCAVQTPGDLISKQLNESLTSGQDSLVAADEFNEFLLGLVTSLASDSLSNTGLLGGSGGFDPYSRASSFEDDVQAIIDAEGVGDVSSGSGGEATGTSGTDLGSSGADQALQFMNEQIAVQTGIESTLTTYISDFNAFIANPRNPGTTTIIADINLNQAESLLDRVNNTSGVAENIRDQYEANAAVYPTASPVDQARILGEQSDFIVRFNRLNLVSQSELNIYLPQWDQLLDTDVPAPIFIPGRCVLNPDRFGCPCDLDPSSIECQESRDRNDDLLFP